MFPSMSNKYIHSTSCCHVFSVYSAVIFQNWHRQFASHVQIPLPLPLLLPPPLLPIINGKPSNYPTKSCPSLYNSEASIIYKPSASPIATLLINMPNSIFVPYWTCCCCQEWRNPIRGDGVCSRRSCQHPHCRNCKESWWVQPGYWIDTGYCGVGLP